MLPSNRAGASPAKPGQSAPASAELIRLGTFTSGANGLAEFIAAWNARLALEAEDAPDQVEWLTVLPFEPYCYAVKNRRRIESEQRQRRFLSHQAIDAEDMSAGNKLAKLGEEDPAVLRFLALAPDPRWTPDQDGWRRYITTKVIRLDELMTRWDQRRFGVLAEFPEIARRMHTLIVAGTGHGKSEAIKALLYHYAFHSSPRAGVIVLDPGRNLAEDVARWPILHRDGRVIYVEPELRPGLTVGINPFSGGHLLDERVKSHLAETIALAVSEMTADLTANMRTLVGYLCAALLEQPDATMQDLGRMAHRPGDKDRFIDERRERLVYAAYYHRDPDVRDFFQYRFDAQTYAASRDALAGRIDGVSSMLDVRNTLFGPATLDLERELNAGKFVLVNLNKYGGREHRAAVGRMLVALVAGIANRRGQASPPYTPIHLVVDEVTAMASAPMIWTLAEQRKFGLHATLAQQVGGAAFTSEEAHALITNTKCRLIATGNPKEGAGLLEHRGAADALPPLSEGQFWVRWGDAPEVQTVKVRSDLVVRNKQGERQLERNPEHWLPEAEWRAYLDRLTAPPDAGGYYRQARTRAFHTDRPPARTPPPAPPPGASMAPAPVAAPAATPKPKRTPGRTTKAPAFKQAEAKPAATSTRKRAARADKKPPVSGTDDDEPS